MLRFLILYLPALVAPSLIYAAWVIWRRRRGLAPREFPGRWAGLLAVGALLTLLIAFLHDDASRGAPGEVYQAPHMEGGKIVRGRSLPPEGAAKPGDAVRP
ncbi:MAG: DUF6111 family protein [Alphaproteobacteria bacterium]